MDLPPHKREVIAGVILPVMFIAIERILPDKSAFATTAFFAAAGVGFTWGFWHKLTPLLAPLRRVRLRSPLYMAPEVAQDILAIRDKTLALEQQRSSFASERSALDSEVRRLAEREAALESDNRSLRMGMRYGESRSMPALDPHDLTAVREHVAEMLKLLEAAHEGAADILSRFLELMSTKGEKSSDLWLGAFLQENFERAQRTHGLLRERMAAKEDPRVALVLWYGKYNWMRQWVKRLAEIHGVTLYGVAGYPEWSIVDRQFFALFNRKVEVERLEAVKDEVRRYAQNNNYPEDLP